MQVFQPNEKYVEQVSRYSKKEGILAIGRYFLYLALCFLQGFLYLTNINYSVLSLLQITFGIVDIVVCIAFIKSANERLTSVGFNKSNIIRSLLYGFVSAIILRTLVLIIEVISKGGTLTIQPVSIFIIVSFVVGAVAEELVFRGYIQTRLRGLFKSYVLASCINAVLFLSIHYPVRWVTTGSVDFTILSGLHIIYLVLLHFLCDFVYRKTNCIWGAMLLHFLFNISGAIIVLA